MTEPGPWHPVDDWTELVRIKRDDQDLEFENETTGESFRLGFNYSDANERGAPDPTNYSQKPTRVRLVDALPVIRSDCH